jgi:poly(hydroxyalkanoate) depolymerase family esterase
VFASFVLFAETGLSQWKFPGLPTYGANPDQEGTTESGSFSNKAGTRSFSVYVPKNLGANPGLVVVLHGCFMTGDQMASGTLLNTFADKKNFVVLYPEQTYADNSWKCWNWFKPENQKRDSGEASIVAGMTLETVKKYKIDNRKIYVTGISAGAALGANLLGCYSDIFSGGLLHSGLEFAAAQTEDEAHSVVKTPPTRAIEDVAKQALACSPKRKTPMTVIFVHGEKDPYVADGNSERSQQIFESVNKNIFLSNGGQAKDITKAKSRIEQTGYRYSANVQDTLVAGKIATRYVLVEAMGHAWSGGQSTAPYMEPRGIDATKVLVETLFP